MSRRDPWGPGGLESSHVPTLREKLAASAATRLRLPPGRLPCEEADRFRRFLKVESQRLRMWHRGGGGGREVCRARAEMMDTLLQHVFDAYLAVYLPKFHPEPLALVALGGYGRSELNPLSDVDLLIEVTGPTSPWFPGGLVAQTPNFLRKGPFCFFSQLLSAPGAKNLLPIAV